MKWARPNQGGPIYSITVGPIYLDTAIQAANRIDAACTTQWKLASTPTVP
jgi:hypothetical protein